jgi:hypothetical protein
MFPKLKLNSSTLFDSAVEGSRKTFMFNDSGDFFNLFQSKVSLVFDIFSFFSISGGFLLLSKYTPNSLIRSALVVGTM